MQCNFKQEWRFLLIFFKTLSNPWLIITNLSPFKSEVWELERVMSTHKILSLRGSVYKGVFKVKSKYAFSYQFDFTKRSLFFIFFLKISQVSGYVLYDLLGEATETERITPSQKFLFSIPVGLLKQFQANR